MEPSKRLDIHLSIPLSFSPLPDRLRSWLPSRGNVLFTLMICILFFFATSANARQLFAQTSSSTGTIAYQGRLADSGGQPLTGTYPMVFRLYNSASNGTPLWEEQWTASNSVAISDGLFNVMLGSLTPISQATLTGNSSLWLGISVGSDSEMTPRVQLGSVPFAFQALTVPDGAITSAKLANGSVSQAKLGADVSLVPPDGSINTAKLADGAITAGKINLQSGTSCVQSNPATIVMPGNYQEPTPIIPELRLDFNLSQPSKVLIWIQGNALMDDGANIDEVGVGFYVDNIRQTYAIHYTDDNFWWNINGQRILDLDAGAHFVDVHANSGSAGTLKITGASTSSMKTCIYFLVISSK